MRAKFANLNYCAVPFLSRAAVNLSWYYYILYDNIMIVLELGFCEDSENRLHLSIHYYASTRYR